MLSRAVQNPSVKNPFYGFVITYAIRLLRSCSELVSFCARVEAWPNTVAITEPNLITTKQGIVNCLQRVLGPILLSLLVFLSNTPAHIERVPSLLLALRQASFAFSVSRVHFGLCFLTMFVCELDSV